MAELLGHLHQSFVGKHSLAQWTDHASKTAIDLGSGHLDKLGAVTHPTSGKTQLESYQQVFGRPGDPPFRDEKAKLEKSEDVQIVWTAVPFKQAEAAKNSERLMGV